MLVSIGSYVLELSKLGTGETFVPSIYQFTRNNEEREMLKLGLVKPNSYTRVPTPCRPVCRGIARHDRRRPVHARDAQREAQADLCAEGLAGEPVAISESVASWDYR
jgi:hypothetical protein